METESPIAKENDLSTFFHYIFSGIVSLNMQLSEMTGWCWTPVSFPQIFLMLSPSDFTHGWQPFKNTENVLSSHLFTSLIKKITWLWIYIFPIGFKHASSIIFFFFHSKQTTGRSIRCEGVFAWASLRVGVSSFSKIWFWKSKTISLPIIIGVKIVPGLGTRDIKSK